MVDREQLKEVVNLMCKSLEGFAEKIPDFPEGTGDAARFELMKFLMYLSASDGTIQWDEAEAIVDICGVNIDLTPSNLGDYIRKNNIYSTDFETKVPATFAMMVTIDNVIAENGGNTSGSEAMLGTYKAVGLALIEADGDVDENEMSDFNIYIRMLEKYRDDNIISSSNSASGFVKNGNGVSAPSKGGVAAPKKG